MSELSRQGAVIGTAAYMSPDRRAASCSMRAAISSALACFYEMVSGRRPFQGTSSAAVAAAILT